MTSVPVNPETAREEELAVRLLESANRVSMAAGIGAGDIKNTMREAAACIVSQTAELAGLRTALSKLGERAQEIRELREEAAAARDLDDRIGIRHRIDDRLSALGALAVSVTPPEGEDG